MQARVDQGLPRVHENHPDKAWALTNWASLRQKRPYYRSHFPLYTTQTMQDSADRTFQKLSLSGFPTHYSENEARMVQDGDLVFVNTIWPEWLRDLAPKITATRFNVHLFDGDNTFCDSDNARKLKAMPNVVRIFAANACPHPKVVNIPLGLQNNLEYPTLEASETWMFFGDELKLLRFFRDSIMQNKKTKDIFGAMSVATNPAKREPAMAHLQKLAADTTNDLKLTLQVNASKRLSQADFFTTMTEHKFVASPEGNGADAHRTWEALYLGTIPILTESLLGPALFEGLPVVFIKDWAEITPERLEMEWDKYVNAPVGTYNYEKLFAPYWIDLMHNTTR